MELTTLLILNKPATNQWIILVLGIGGREYIYIYNPPNQGLYLVYKRYFSCQQRVIIHDRSQLLEEPEQSIEPRFVMLKLEVLSKSKPGRFMPLPTGTFRAF